MGLVINKGAKIKGTLTSGTGDPLLTRDTTTSDLGTVPNIGTLSDGKIFIGNNANLPTEQTVTGDISLSDTGVAAISSGVIINTDVSASAAIALTKLAATTPSKVLVSDSSGFIIAATTTSTEIGYLSGTTSLVQTQLNSKQTTITGAASTIVSANLASGVVAVTNGSGKIAASSVLASALDNIASLTSDAQTQLNARLSVSLGSLSTGDLAYYNGSAWTNLPRGTNGQTLQSTSSTIAWNTPTINGIPTGGTSGQYLAKLSGTPFDADWTTLTLSKVTDVTATASEVNILSGVTTTTTQLNYLNTITSDVQTQINNKQSSVLPNNSIWVGNVSNVSSVLAPGSSGQVLQISAGVPTWQTITGTGTVTSIDVSGGATGLTTSGGPISTSGTITFGGTLNETHGGTNQTTYATGDILYASGTDTLSKLGIGTSGYIIKSSGGIPTWAPNTSTSPLTTKGDIFVFSTVDTRLPIGTDGYHLIADSTQTTGLKWDNSTGAPFSDASALVKNASDATKLAIFDASSIGTGTTRTYTLPNASGTIALLGAGDGAALTKTNDTNVTLTLGGSPTTALLAATSLTLGWTGQLAETRGGTNQGTYTLGDILYSSATNTLSKLAGNTTGTNKFLAQTGTGTVSAAPGWVTLVSGDIPNNAANTTGSAAKWTTARNLAGNSVDGSANVAFANLFVVQGTSDSGLSGAQFLGALGTGIVKNTTTTGVLSIAVAGDFPTLNQNTTGSAATLTTARAIYGNNFDGSAALTQIIASTYGGTGNGFTKFSGPTTGEKTFTLPNASATILTDNAVVTLAQGGTNANLTASNGGIFYSTASAAAILSGTATANKMLLSGATAAPTWSTSTIPTSAGSTANKVLKSDGTNYVLSTETYATPGTSGNLLTSDGTNWLSSAPTFWSLANGGTATGTNTFTMGSNPFIFSTGVTTGTGATAGLQLVANSLTTGNAFDVSTSSLTTGNLVKLSSTSTAAGSNSQTILNVSTSGANGTSTQSTWGIDVSNTHTGTSSTNIAMRLTASGGTNNYALITAGGNVGIGTSAPTGILHIVGSGSIPTLQIVGVGTGTNYSLRAFQSDGTTETFSLKDSGLINHASTVKSSSFSSTWTSTVTGDSAYQFGGNVTGNSTNGTSISHTVFSPTLTYVSGTTQNATAVQINPTFSGSFANMYKLLVGTTGTVNLGVMSTGEVTINKPTPTPNTALDIVALTSNALAVAVNIKAGGTATSIPLNIDNGSGQSLMQVSANGSIVWVQKTGVNGIAYKYTQAVLAGAGAPTGLQFNSGAHTSLTGETIDLDFINTRAVGFNAQTLANQRSIKFGVPTYASTSGTTAITDATNVWVGGAPIITGGTITGVNSHGILVVSSAVTSNVTNSYGLTSNAPTGAANNYAAQFLGGKGVYFDTTTNIIGTSTNNNATAGNIGEETNSIISTYTNYTTTATYQAITSITLTAGDWDISAFGTFNSNTATVTAASNAIFAISTTTASAAGATEGLNIVYLPQAALVGTSKESIAIPPYRVSISGTTTYYFNTQSTFTLGNPQFVGGIRARRQR